MTTASASKRGLDIDTQHDYRNHERTSSDIHLFSGDAANSGKLRKIRSVQRNPAISVGNGTMTTSTATLRTYSNNLVATSPNNNTVSTFILGTGRRANQPQSGSKATTGKSAENLQEELTQREMEIYCLKMENQSLQSALAQLRKQLSKQNGPSINGTGYHGPNSAGNPNSTMMAVSATSADRRKTLEDIYKRASINGYKTHAKATGSRSSRGDKKSTTFSLSNIISPLGIRDAQGHSTSNAIDLLNPGMFASSHILSALISPKNPQSTRQYNFLAPTSSQAIKATPVTPVVALQGRKPESARQHSAKNQSKDLLKVDSNSRDIMTSSEGDLSILKGRFAKVLSQYKAKVEKLSLEKAELAQQLSQYKRGPSRQHPAEQSVDL